MTTPCATDDDGGNQAADSGSISDSSSESASSYSTKDAHTAAQERHYAEFAKVFEHFDDDKSGTLEAFLSRRLTFTCENRRVFMYSPH